MPLELRELGSYEILEPIGAGGMGEVYKARDKRLERLVALKILPADFANDPDRVRRFKNEAKAAAALSYPNVAQIYEVGESREIRFIAMEYVQGCTLDQLIKSGPLDAKMIAQIGIQVAEALNEAHKRGVTHRDIKPSNIMLTSSGVVKVLDFGLAKLIKDLPSRAGTEISTIIRTRPGSLFGTIQYLSPEQALGLQTDSRSDIFSVGIVLYEMSTGELPFRGRTVGQTLDQIIHAQPKLPSELNPRVPADLEKLILKCLEKKPVRRYQSSSDISKDLTNLKQTGFVLPLFLRQLTYRVPLFVLALLLMLVIATAALYYSLNTAQDIDSLAILSFVNENKDPELEYISDGITESLINNLSRVSNLRLTARDSVFTYKAKKLAPQKVGADLRVAGVLSGRVLKNQNQLTVQAELLKTADGSRLWAGQYQGRPVDIGSIQEQIADELSKRIVTQRTLKTRPVDMKHFNCG